MTQKRIFEFGGYVAAAVLIAFGIASLVMGVNGRNEVRTDVKREFVVGTPDMNKTAILAEAKQAHLPADVIAELPTCNVANKEITNGTRAKCFASYMRVHTLESTGGKTYAQMGRYLLPNGKDTNDATKAARDPKTGQPVENSARNLWVTYLAIGTSLNTAFFAEQVSLFSIVIGIALLLVGLGLGILDFVTFRVTGRSKTTAAEPVIGTAKPQAS